MANGAAASGLLAQPLPSGAFLSAGAVRLAQKSGKAFAELKEHTTEVTEVTEANLYMNSLNIYIVRVIWKFTSVTSVTSVVRS